MAPCAIKTLISRSISGLRRRLINIGRATRPKACVTPSCLRSSPRLDASTGSYSGFSSTSPTRRPPTPSRSLVRPSMLNLRFTAGVGVGISGACEPPLVWRARKPLPRALRSSAALALGLAMQRAPATELVFWHRASDCAPKLSLFCLFLFPLFKRETEHRWV